jgi:hypothetical protein
MQARKASAMAVKHRDPILGPRSTRRQFLVAMGVGLIGVACGGGGGGPGGAAAGSIDDLTSSGTKLSVLGTGADGPPMNPGQNRLAFDLVTPQGGLLHGGSPNVWIGRDTTSRALGPFPATWHPFTAYDQTHDRSPRSPLLGAYAVPIAFPSAGVWNLAVTVGNGSQRQAGTGLIQITGGQVVAGLGTKAISTPTPVTMTPRKLREICSRVPPDPMHYVSLDRALGSGKPTVVVFSTPLLCESRLCGPVTDEVLLLFKSMGPGSANFIHVEEFLPGPDLKPLVPTQDDSPAFKRWGLESEPWVFVIDRTGTIRFRSLGPVTAPEIEAVLRSLL